jgi:hypothetical protein
MSFEAALIALFFVILAYWHNQDYPDTLHFKFKQYGDVQKPAVVVIPGLDGATEFFTGECNVAIIL